MIKFDDEISVESVRVILARMEILASTGPFRASLQPAKHAPIASKRFTTMPAALIERALNYLWFAQAVYRRRICITRRLHYYSECYYARNYKRYRSIARIKSEPRQRALGKRSETQCQCPRPLGVLVERSAGNCPRIASENRFEQSPRHTSLFQSWLDITVGRY